MSSPLFIQACIDGYLNVVELCLINKINFSYVSEGFIIAIRNKHNDIAKQLLKSSPHINLSDFIYTSCLYYNKEIIDLITEQNNDIQWDEALFGACEGNHPELVEYLCNYTTNYDHGFIGACSGGHKNMMELMISKYNSLTDAKKLCTKSIDWNTGLSFCPKSKTDLVKYLIDNGATNIKDALNQTLDTTKTVDTILLLLEKGEFSEYIINRISLSINDIYYLYKKDITYTRYTEIYNLFRQSHLISENVLSSILLPDIVNIILTF